MFKRRGRALGLVVLAIVGMASPAPGEDDFPIIGTYTRDITCKGTASDRPDLKVKITRMEIASNMGICEILNRKRDGRVFSLHLGCRVPGDQIILGDVTFTIRDDSTLDFEDQDHTSDAVLHKCTD